MSHTSTTNLLRYLMPTQEKALLVEALKLLFSAQNSSQAKILLVNLAPKLQEVHILTQTGLVVYLLQLREQDMYP
jgi:hypothetical protein